MAAKKNQELEHSTGPEEDQLDDEDLDVLDEEDDGLDEDDEVDEEEDDEPEAGTGATGDLDEILATRPARQPIEDDSDTDIVSFGDPTTVSERLPSRVIPIKDRQEFVCKRCYLVKARSQLADADRMLCRDCV